MLLRSSVASRKAHRQDPGFKAAGPVSRRYKRNLLLFTNTYQKAPTLLPPPHHLQPPANPANFQTPASPTPPARPVPTPTLQVNHQQRKEEEARKRRVNRPSHPQKHGSGTMRTWMTRRITKRARAKSRISCFRSQSTSTKSRHECQKSRSSWKSFQKLHT